MSTKTNLNSWLQKAAATETSRPGLTWQYSDGAVSMTADGYRAHFVWDGAAEGFTALKKSVNGGDAGKFPDALAIIPQQPDYTVSVDAEAMRHALKIVAAMADDYGVSLTFDEAYASTAGGQLILSVYNPERGTVQTAISFTGHIVNQPNHRTYVLRYLSDAFSGFEGPVQLAFVETVRGSSSKPLAVGTIGKQMALLMPYGSDTSPCNMLDHAAIIATQRTQTQPDNVPPFAVASKPRKVKVAPFTAALKEAQTRRTKAYKQPSPDDLPTGGRMDAVVKFAAPQEALIPIVDNLVKDSRIYRQPVYAAFNPANGALYLQVSRNTSYRVYVNGHTAISKVSHYFSGPMTRDRLSVGESIPYADLLAIVRKQVEASGLSFVQLN